MNALWINVPLMVVFFAAWTGIPLWLSLRHTDTGPVTAATPAPAGDLTLAAPLWRDAELVGALT